MIERQNGNTTQKTVFQYGPKHRSIHCLHVFAFIVLLMSLWCKTAISSGSSSISSDAIYHLVHLTCLPHSITYFSSSVNVYTNFSNGYIFQHRAQLARIPMGAQLLSALLSTLLVLSIAQKGSTTCTCPSNGCSQSPSTG